MISRISTLERVWRLTVAWAFTLAALFALGDPGAAAADFDPARTESWLVPNPDLYGVCARGDLVYAVGYWGAALRSADRGKTWTRQPTPTDRSLYAVSFGSESNGWAVGAGGTLLHSVDGGLSWATLSVELAPDEFGDVRELDTPLFDVSSVSAHEAWAVGDFGILIHTLDGASWEQVPIAPESFADENLPDRILNAVDFTDRDHGWIAGEFGTALRTVDGGQTWFGERAFEGAVEDVYLMDVAAGPDGGAIATGTGGVVIRTADGGAQWTVSEIATTGGLFGTARRGDRAIVVGDRGIIFASGDAGVTWTDPPRPKLFNWLRGTVLGRDGLAFAVGQSGVVLRSTDAGQSWKQAAGRGPTSREDVSPWVGGPETDQVPDGADAQ